MLLNNLRLNNDETELFVLHAKHRPKPPLDSITVGDATVEPTSSARNIGVVFDDTMIFKEHVNELCRTAFYHMRNISRIRPCLSIDSTKTLVHALVTCRLDHCNALLYGLPDYLIQRQQYVMNVAAKVSICKQKFVTPLLIELHLLPVRQRIVFKIFLYTFKALHGVTPMYLTELISPYIPRQDLRSADQLLLEQPTHKLKSISFEVIIFNKLHHFSLEASYPVGYAEWEPSELVESTLSFKCSVRLLIFFKGYLEVERTEDLVLSYFINCIADPRQRKCIKLSESIDCL
ncbi:uncharacterized protein LOC122962150 [Acropora millepora]|uniref:uncharacterized protein LOC122962150 n=1 Tax=Acropora millepora TaxID=45264 RepID=UPI001CF5FE6F|nr:uncharacterized protein LOC122962150 [Acropora millepora]